MIRTYMYIYTYIIIIKIFYKQTRGLQTYNGKIEKTNSAYITNSAIFTFLIDVMVDLLPKHIDEQYNVEQ